MMRDPDFFIGWDARMAPRLARFVLAIAASATAEFLLLAVLLGRAVDIGAGEALGEVSIAGVLETRPYAMVRAPPDAGHPDGHVTILAGDFKYGFDETASNTFAGQAVEIRGALVKRGDLDMVLVAPNEGISAVAAAPSRAAPSISLGKWRVSGEICDGKCATGAMRPGRGLAHKACANLCVSGGVPPVFVASSPVEGAQFMLLADVDGGRPPLASLLDLAAIPVTLEGEIERRGDLAILRVDWTKARAR